MVDLERESAELRAQIPAQPNGGLGADTTRVLVHLFKATGPRERDIGALARHLQMEQSVAKYHLDRLRDHKFATKTGGNYVHGHTYWGVTAEGRRHVVENGLA